MAQSNGTTENNKPLMVTSKIKEKVTYAASINIFKNGVHSVLTVLKLKSLIIKK